MARFVHPHFQRSRDLLRASYDYAVGHRADFVGRASAAIQKAIDRHAAATPPGAPRQPSGRRRSSCGFLLITGRPRRCGADRRGEDSDAEPEPIFDDLARMASGAAGALTGVRGEIEARFRDQLERILAGMDLVSREEFEAARAMAAKAREEQEILLRRIDALETRLAALERRGDPGPGPSVT